jgi:hypothetical protein
MTEQEQQEIIDQHDLLEFANETWEHPGDWIGNIEYDRCEFTGRLGECVPIQCEDVNGDIHVFSVSESVARLMLRLADSLLVKDRE